MRKVSYVGEDRKDSAQMKRELGFSSALAFGVGTMIAGGIFALLGFALSMSGTAIIIVFVLLGIKAMISAASYAELSSAFPKAGGGYVYINKAYPSFLSYFGGFSLLIGYIASCALYLRVFYDFAGFLGLPSLLLMTAVVVILTFFNIRGVKDTGWLQIVLTGVKVAVLVLFVILGLRFINPSNYSHAFKIQGIFPSFALLFITFFGFEVIATAAEETRDVKEAAHAIVWSVIITVFIYLAVSVVTIGVLGAISMNGAEKALFNAADLVFGRPLIIGLATIISATSAANATIMASARVSYALAKDGKIPHFFSHLNKTTDTPVWGILGVVVIAVLMVAFLPVEKVAQLTTFFLMIAIGLINLSVIVLRRKYPDVERPIKVPFYPLTPILGMLISFALIAVLPLEQILWGSVISAVYIFLFACLHFLGKKNKRSTS